MDKIAICAVLGLKGSRAPSINDVALATSKVDSSTINSCATGIDTRISEVKSLDYNLVEAIIRAKGDREDYQKAYTMLGFHFINCE